MDNARRALKAMTRVTRILKQRFHNLTTDETALLAADIIEAIITVDEETTE